VFLQFLVKIPGHSVCIFYLAYRCRPINHDTDERCHTATGAPQDCDATVELFEGNQKMKLLGLGAEISSSIAFVVGALEVISSRPRVNCVIMQKGDSRPGDPQTIIEWSAIRFHAGISRSRIAQPVSDSACRSEGTYKLSYRDSMTIGKMWTIQPSKSERVGTLTELI
jgi:hypothetical protein